MKHYVIKARSGWIALDFQEWADFFDLFLILIVRDIKLRYKQTALGIIWVILQPLLTSLMFTIIFGKLAKMPSDGIPYILFALAGILPWTIFSQSVLKASLSVVSQAHLISKVYFPRIMIPASACIAGMVDYLINLAIVFVMMIIYHTPFTVHLFLLIPLTLFVLLFSLGTGLLFCAFNVFYRDFGIALPFLMQIWMFASPLVYSASLIPQKWKLLYMLNPLSGLIDGFRWALFEVGPFPWQSFGISVLFSFAACFAGIYIFHRVERHFADVI